MDLAPPSGLLFALLGAALVWAVGLASPAPARRALVWTGGGAATLTAVALALYVGLGLSIAAWRDHPQTARIVAVGGLALVVACGVRALQPARPNDAYDDADEDDDGGQPRLRAPRPRDPGPSAAPTPTGPPWPDFDAARQEWERPPAGVV